MNKIDYVKMRAGLEQMLLDAERTHRVGARDPDSKLRILRDVLDDQIRGYDLWAEKYPPIPEIAPGLDLLKEIVSRVQASLDAGPRGPLAPLPELKDAFLIEPWQSCEATDKKLPNPLRFPYSANRFDADLFTLWGKGEGIWHVEFEVYNEKGELVDRQDKGDLELPFPGFPDWHGRLCWRMHLSFHEPETQTIVLSLAGQEVRRLSVTYEDSRV